MNMLILHGVLAASLATAPALPPKSPCEGKLPQAFIETVNNTSFAQTSRSDWIVSWGKLPLSDWQTALLAEDDEVRERLERTWRSRGAWVYAGLTASVVGAGISSSDGCSMDKTRSIPSSALVWPSPGSQLDWSGPSSWYAIERRMRQC